MNTMRPPTVMEIYADPRFLHKARIEKTIILQEGLRILSANSLGIYLWETSSGTCLDQFLFEQPKLIVYLEVTKAMNAVDLVLGASGDRLTHLRVGITDRFSMGEPQIHAWPKDEEGANLTLGSVQESLWVFSASSYYIGYDPNAGQQHFRHQIPNRLDIGEFQKTGKFAALQDYHLGEVGVVDIESGREIITIPVQNGLHFCSLHFTAKNTLLIGDDSKQGYRIRRFSLPNGECLQEIYSPKGTGPAFMSVGQDELFAVVSYPQDSAFLVNLQNGETLRKMTPPVAFGGVCFSGAANLWLASDEGRVYPQKLDTGESLVNLGWQSGSFDSVTFLPNSGFLLLSDFRQLVLLNPASGEVVFQTQCEKVKVAPDRESFLFYTGGENSSFSDASSVYRYLVSDQSLTPYYAEGLFDDLRYGGDRAFSLEYGGFEPELILRSHLPNGRGQVLRTLPTDLEPEQWELSWATEWIIGVSADGFWIWKFLESNIRENSFPSEWENIEELGIFPDGKHVFISTDEYNSPATLAVLSLPDFETKWQRELKTSSPGAMGVDTAGQVVAIAEENTVLILDAQTGKLLYEIELDTRVRSLSFGDPYLLYSTLQGGTLVKIDFG